VKLVLAGACALVAVACLVDRKSDELVCSSQADCASDRVCQDGYCVKSGQSDCPDHCATCNTQTSPHTCVVVDTDGDDFRCPSGYQCLLQCTTGSCGDITCEDDSQCVISCTGANACGDISCQNACACDVTCTGGGCMTLQCPRDGNTYCTPSQQDGGPCTSQPGGRCNSC
jgi:hypothetical protein